MAGINPVQRRPTEKTKHSKTAKGLGDVLGVVGGVAGGIAGGIAAAPSGPGIAAGATAGAAGGFSGGRQLGRFIGEKVDPTRTIRGETSISTGGVQPLRVSQQGQLFGEALQILNRLPSSIAQPHSRALTDAFMQDLATHNRRS